MIILIEKKIEKAVCKISTILLLPQYVDNPILLFSFFQFNDSKVGFEQGLQQFNQLLNSKQFLVIFIRTLEQQKNFSIRDR